MVNDISAKKGQLLSGVLDSPSFLIILTAHKPLKRINTLLNSLMSYDSLPGSKDVYIFIDFESKEDLSILEETLNPNFETLNVNYVVAPAEYTGYSLTWAHKPFLKELSGSSAYDTYIYAEDDMLFTKDNYRYWVTYKPILKTLGLEPGFCRYEVLNEKKVPFDNYRVWRLNGLTPSVWGSRPYKVESFNYLGSDSLIGFASLGNPYAGLMVLDKSDLQEYIDSDSFDPVKSYALTRHRNWPIADRSSMGLAFENLKGDREHRRVVPLEVKEGHVVPHVWGLVRHQDTKYSEALSKEEKQLITTDSMFSLV